MTVECLMCSTAKHESNMIAHRNKFLGLVYFCSPKCVIGLTQMLQEGP